MVTYTNCPNCGAPIKTGKCPYCGTTFVEPNIMAVYADNRVFMSFEVFDADERINECYNVGTEW